LARHVGFEADLSLASAQRELWAYAEQRLPPARRMAAYTQGLMDIGATLCLPRQPRCADCPLRQDCVARRTDRTTELPLKSRRLLRGARSHALLWLRHRDHVLLVRRPERGVWAGLWSLPEFADLGAARAAAKGWPGRGEALPAIDHALTHFDWHLLPLRWNLPARTAEATRERIARDLGGRWLPQGDALAMSLPAPVRRLLV
jgi:A/G-specific adenine glycosylase